MKSFASVLENIGKGILKGIEVAAPIVQKIAPEVPVIGPALQEVTSLVMALEKSNAAMTPEEVEGIVAALVTAAHIKTAVISTQANVASGTATK